MVVMYYFLLTKSTKEVLEKGTIDLNQKKKTKKVSWKEFTVIHFDWAFPFTILYKYNIDVPWHAVDIGSEKVRFIKNITCCSLM